MRRPSRHVRKIGRPVYIRNQGAKKRRRLPQVANFLQIAILVVAAFLLLIGASRITKVSEIKVDGTSSLPPAKIQRLVGEGLSRQWFGSSLLMVNSSALEGDLLAKEAGIKKVVIKRRLPGTLTVKITEHSPSLNWKTTSGLYLLDNEGVVLGESRGEYSKLPAVHDSSNLPVKKGDRVAPSAFVAFCIELASRLPETKLTITEMQVPETTSEIHVKTSKGFVIKFDTTRPAGEQIQDLQAVLSHLAAQKKSPAEYIDLRIEQKAYYK
ncbi:MAG TPA: FtsQ-type POTRA domain-containing protein [Candidatus Dormibacteraeota bacterium]|nr:FtsQ-type POTRA domain-containing protein [Candidatus Dormibacteraeota bacterium]